MKSHHPAGTLLCAALAAVALAVLYASATAGCYKCTDPSCQNLPCPGGDPGPCLERERDAGRAAGDASR